MTPQELKNSILQLAIQGKLVEQRPEEGTAKEVYQQIQIKMPNLMNQKEINDEEIPFEVPESWFWIRLGTALIIERGGSPRPIKAYLTDSDNGINWIKIGDTEKGGKYINSTKEKITPEGMKKSRFVRKGDFLLSNSMSFGRPYILNIDGCIHDGWLVLRQVVELFEKDYLYYLLSSPMVFHQFCTRVAGAVVNNLNSDKVALTVVPVPPLAEQKRIAAKIEELLPYVDRYEKAWSKLEELNKRFPTDLQKSILQMAIQGKLVEQIPEEGTGEELYQQIQAEKQRLIKEGKLKKEKPLPEITEDEKPFDIPESWKWVRLGYLVQVIGGISYNKDDITKEGLRILRGGNIQNMKVLVEDDDVFLPPKYDNEDKRIRLGDILIVASTGSKTVIGKAGYVDRDIPNTMIGAFLRICRSYSLEIVDYLRYIFDSNLYRMHIRDKSQGTNINNVKETYITELAIPLPPLAEQKRIVAKIEELMPLCEKLKRD